VSWLSSHSQPLPCVVHGWASRLTCLRVQLAQSHGGKLKEGGAIKEIELRQAAWTRPLWPS
jgi:hypothetical protein